MNKNTFFFRKLSIIHETLEKWQPIKVYRIKIHWLLQPSSHRSPKRQCLLIYQSIFFLAISNPMRIFLHVKFPYQHQKYSLMKITHILFQREIELWMTIRVPCTVLRWINVGERPKLHSCEIYGIHTQQRTTMYGFIGFITWYDPSLFTWANPTTNWRITSQIPVNTRCPGNNNSLCLYSS